jgi:heme exporter protein D
MSEPVPDYVISDEEFSRLLHPKEQSRFVLALIIVSPFMFLALLLTIFTAGLFLFWLGMIAFFVWLSLRMLTLALIGNAVRVTPDNFPEMYAVLEEVKRRLNYTQDVGMYIVNEGGLNAILYKFLSSRFIVLPETLAADMANEANRSQLVFIVGRFVGALKAKHFRLGFAAMVITSIEKLRFLNLFLLPYERAIQYSGDQIGLALCRDLDAATTALAKFMVGEKLGAKVQLRGVLQQGSEVHTSFLGWLLKLGSAHPPLVSRYMNVLAFARYRYPAWYQRFVLKFGNVPLQMADALLPRDHPIPAGAGWAPAPAGTAVGGAGTLPQ